MKKPFLFLALLAVIILAGMLAYARIGNRPETAPLLAGPEPTVTSTQIATPAGVTGPTSSAARALPAKAGSVTGLVDIGPLCPNERFPEEEQCKPQPRHYAQYAIVLYDAARSRVLKRAPIAADGTYRIDISPGTYVVDIEPHQESGVGGVSGVPRTVAVKAEESSRVDITIDTGIR